MSMTLESAIVHAEEVADRCAVTDGNRQCEDEHRQLAAWLRELAERRKEPEIVRCGECRHWKDRDGVYRRGISAESKCPVNSRQVYEGTFFCGMAERRTDENNNLHV